MSEMHGEELGPTQKLPTLDDLYAEHAPEDVDRRYAEGDKELRVIAAAEPGVIVTSRLSAALTTTFGGD